EAAQPELQLAILVLHADEVHVARPEIAERAGRLCADALQRPQNLEKHGTERIEAPHAAAVHGEQNERQQKEEPRAEENLISPDNLEHDGSRSSGPGWSSRRAAAPRFLGRTQLIEWSRPLEATARRALCRRPSPPPSTDPPPA